MTTPMWLIAAFLAALLTGLTVAGVFIREAFDDERKERRRSQP